MNPTQAAEKCNVRDPAFRRFVDVPHYSDLAVSPDGATAACVSTALGSKALSLHALGPTLGDTAARTLPSGSDLAPDRVVWSPDGSWLLVTADRGGTEAYELHAVDVANGAWRPLSCDDGVRHELGASPLSPDGRQIAFGSNARSAADFDVVVMDVGTRAARTLLATGDWLVPASWSPDGRHLLVVRFDLSTNQDLLLVDAATGAVRLLTPHAGEAKFTPGPWTPDGRGFLVRSDREREFTGLASFDISTGSLTWLQTPDCDIDAAGLAQDGKQLAWVENERGDSVLYSQPYPGGRVRRKSACSSQGVIWTRTGILPFCGREPALIFFSSTPSAPWSLQRIDLNSGATSRIAPVDDPTAGLPMVEPSKVQFPSSGNTTIDALLYAPAGHGAATRSPCVLAIHGGPEDQERPWYGCSGLFQYLAHRGIGVLAPNIRGSTGYGRAFQKAIHRDFGGVDLEDLAAALQFLVGLPWVDPARIGAFGASYGGFATLSCVARIPHPWAAAVSLVAPVDLVALAHSVPPWWRRVMSRWLGDPDQDTVQLRERSPATHAESIRAPLLLIHGSNDPRVGHGPAEALVSQLRAIGRTAEYLGFANEGHTFASTENLQRVLGASADWFERHLGVSSGARPTEELP